MVMGPGLLEIVILLMGGSLFSADDFLGMPPGDRDAKLIAAAPADAVIYVEWAARSAGEPGAAGVDGLVADPEVVEFRNKVLTAIRTSIENESKNGPPEAQIAGRVIPELVLNLINQPGCVYGTFDPTKIEPGESPSPVPSPEMLIAATELTVIVNAGEKADEVQKQIEELMTLLPPDLRGTGLDRRSLPLPMPGGKLVLHRHDNYFVLALGDEAIDHAIAGLQGDRPGLDTNERFVEAFGHSKFERLANVSWIDTRQAMDKISVMMGVQGAMVRGMLELTGLSAIDSIVLCAGVDNGAISARSFVTTGGNLTGILALAAGRAIEESDFELIPSDADLVIAFSFDPLKVYQEARRIIQVADPQSLEQLDQIVNQLNTELGFSLTEDVPAAFGHVWTVYDSPSSGGVFVTSAVAAVEVKDAEAAYRIFSELMKVMKAAIGPAPDPNVRRRRAVYLQDTKFMDRSVYYLNIVGDDVPFAPTFCCTDKQLLIAAHPQAIKAHLRMLAAKEESYSPNLPESGELICYTQYDAATMVRYAYTLVPYFAQVMSSEIQREGVQGIDIFALPSARAILPYCGTAGSRVLRTETGLKYESRSALPIPGLGSVLMRLPLFGWVMFIQVDRAMRALGKDGRVVPQAVPAARAVPALRANQLKAVQGRVVPAQPAERIIRRGPPAVRKRAVPPKLEAPKQAAPKEAAPKLEGPRS